MNGECSLWANAPQRNVVVELFLFLRVRLKTTIVVFNCKMIFILFWRN